MNPHLVQAIGCKKYEQRDLDEDEEQRQRKNFLLNWFRYDRRIDFSAKLYHVQEVNGIVLQYSIREQQIRKLHLLLDAFVHFLYPTARKVRSGAHCNKSFERISNFPVTVFAANYHYRLSRTLLYYNKGTTFTKVGRIDKPYEQQWQHYCSFTTSIPMSIDHNLFMQLMGTLGSLESLCRTMSKQSFVRQICGSDNSLDPFLLKY